MWQLFSNTKNEVENGWPAKADAPFCSAITQKLPARREQPNRDTPTHRTAPASTSSAPAIDLVAMLSDAESSSGAEAPGPTQTQRALYTVLQETTQKCPHTVQSVCLLLGIAPLSTTEPAEALKALTDCTHKEQLRVLMICTLILGFKHNDQPPPLKQALGPALSVHNLSHTANDILSKLGITQDHRTIHKHSKAQVAVLKQQEADQQLSTLLVWDNIDIYTIPAQRQGQFQPEMEQGFVRSVVHPNGDYHRYIQSGDYLTQPVSRFFSPTKWPNSAIAAL